MSLREHFVQMARNNAHSNSRIYAACRVLDHAALTAKRTSFFSSLFATLKHIWIVDEYYLDAFELGGRGRGIWEDEHRHRDIASLWHAQSAVDRRLLAFCQERKDDAALSAQVTLLCRTGPQTEITSDVLTHLFVHQIHHRGQVHAMLAGTPVAPPQLDEWFLAADRTIAERELAGVLRDETYSTQ